MILERSDGWAVLQYNQEPLLRERPGHENEKPRHRRGENICKNTSDKGLSLRTYKELLELNSRNTNGPEILPDSSPKICGWWENPPKTFGITCLQETGTTAVGRHRALVWTAKTQQRHPTPRRLRGHRSSRSFFQNKEAAAEESFILPYKNECLLPDPASALLGIYPKVWKTCLHRIPCLDVYSGFSHNCQNLEAAKMSCR